MDRLALLGCFSLHRGAHPVRVPMPGRRVLAYLAVHGPTSRAVVAGALWPEVVQERADGSLRNTVWQLGQGCARVLHCHGDMLALSDELVVDLSELTSRALALLAGSEPSAGDSHALICGELLPGWGEDWVRIERERVHQLRLHALESLVDRFIGRRRFDDAMQAAMLAVRQAPLRESAHRAVISVYLAQRDLAHALLHFRDFEETLGRESGLAPSARIRAMLTGCL